MANYTQWRTHIDNTGLPRRVTWVCGDQHVLVDEVITTTVTTVAPEDINHVRLHAGTGPDTAIWAAAHQYPLHPDARRLLVIRDADAIASWQPLHTWLAGTRQLPGTFLLFVSNRPDLPYRHGRVLAPHVAAMTAPRGHLVRCSTLPTAEAIAWARRRAPALSDTTAAHLLARCAGQLDPLAATCTKLALFPGTPDTAVIDALCTARPTYPLVDSLLAGRKPDALTCLPDLDTTDRLAAVALLDQRLDLMHTLWRAAVTATPLRLLDVPSYLAQRYAPLAKHYDRARCAYSRRVLAVVDDALRAGHTDAVMEALIALW